MYKYYYSFWNEKDFPGFKKFLNNLYNSSFIVFEKNNLKNNKYSKDEINHNLNMIYKYIRGIEYYYAYLYKLDFVTKDNKNNILNQLKKLKYIGLFSKEKDKIYGISSYKPRCIIMNPNIKKEFGLNDRFVQQLCLSHEISHIINMSWWSDSKKFSDELYKDLSVKKILKNIDLDDSKYLRYGFSLLDEVVSEEVAEEITYNLAHKSRPDKEYRTDKEVFNYNPYLTNYALYGELQEFAIKFARNLNFINISDNDTDEEVLKKLVQKSFNSDFIKNIKNEILNSDNKDKLIIMLACMGSIKAYTYQILDLEDKSKKIDTTLYTDLFFEISKKNTNKHSKCK